MIIILSGPSGAGKDTLIDMWIESNPRVKRAITATSRPKRATETHGVDYLFFTKEEMEEKIANGDFLEHMNVFGNLYGTPHSSVDDIVNKGGVAIIRVDVAGAIELIPKMEDAISIFILPPSIEELRRRIENRNTETPEKIDERMDIAIAEMICATFYNNQIVNDSVHVALQKLQNTLLGFNYNEVDLSVRCMFLDNNQRTKDKLQQFKDAATEAGIIISE